VTWHKAAGKWHARIQVKGKRKYLGVYDDLEEAAEAYRKAKAELHTFHPDVPSRKSKEAA
jgi:hypothetical protein